MKAAIRTLAMATVLAAATGGALATDNRPIGEPLRTAATKYGLSETDVARVLAAGGELSCPEKDGRVSLLNAWLIASDEIITNAHALIEGEEKRGHPYVRGAPAGCTFLSFLDLGLKRPPLYRLDLHQLGGVLSRSAPPPVDPTTSIAADVLRLRLARPVTDAVPLRFNNAAVGKDDSLLLISRVPTKYQSPDLPGDDLVIQECHVVTLGPRRAGDTRSAITDCNSASGMSAGVVFSRGGDGRLAARGFLVSTSSALKRPGGEISYSYNLMFDDRFASWLTGDCPFWPQALRVDLCGVKAATASR